MLLSVMEVLLLFRIRRMEFRPVFVFLAKVVMFRFSAAILSRIALARDRFIFSATLMGVWWANFGTLSRRCGTALRAFCGCMQSRGRPHARAGLASVHVPCDRPMENGEKRATEEPLNWCLNKLRLGKTTLRTGSSPVHPAILIPVFGFSSIARAMPEERWGLV